MTLLGINNGKKQTPKKLTGDAHKILRSLIIVEGPIPGLPQEDTVNEIHDKTAFNTSCLFHTFQNLFRGGGSAVIVWPIQLPQHVSRHINDLFEGVAMALDVMGQLSLQRMEPPLPGQQLFLGEAQLPAPVDPRSPAAYSKS